MAPQVIQWDGKSTTKTSISTKFGTASVVFDVPDDKGFSTWVAVTVPEPATKPPMETAEEYVRVKPDGTRVTRTITFDPYPDWQPPPPRTFYVKLSEWIIAEGYFGNITDAECHVRYPELFP